MEPEKRKKLIDLGFANGWLETPAIVARCHGIPGHPVHFPDGGDPGRPIYNCVRSHWCDECGYIYDVDSSG